MTGVEIINTYEKIDMFSIIFLIMLLVIAIFCVSLMYKSYSIICMPDVLFMMFVSLVCVVGIWYAFTHPSIMYEARIDKTASYLELTDKYEIVENCGDMYVLKEN